MSDTAMAWIIVACAAIIGWYVGWLKERAQPRARHVQAPKGREE